MPVATATVNPNVPAAQQATSNDPAGLTVFPLKTSLGGFFGATPSAQPSGNPLAPLVRGAASGIVTGWASYQTAFVSGGVATITAAESNLTIQQGTITSARVLLTAGDMVYLNKPTSQAGLGVGNVRVQASNTVGVTLNNPTAATITPTVTEVYRIASTRGVPTIALVISPAAVQPNSITEQQFTVPTVTSNAGGVTAGSLVGVMKPTAQAGLDIVGMRAVANNVIGISFANFTAATITPTAAESYTVQSLFPLDAHGDFLLFTMNGGAVGSLGGGEGGVISGGNHVFTGALATDLAVGPPLAPTAANNGLAGTNSSSPALSVMTTDNMTMWFNTIGSASTPTANVYWDQLIFRLNPAAPFVLYTQTLTPASVAANTTAEQTFTVTGLLANTVVWVNKGSWTANLGIAGVRVSAASTLAVNYVNTSSVAIVPPSETYVIGNFQMQAPTPTTSNTTGGAVTQQVAQGISYSVHQLAALRAALVTLGMSAGA